MPWLPGGVADALADFRRGLTGRFGDRVEVITLFGSYARGDFAAESDVDVLVVVRGLTWQERREVFDLAYDVYAERLVDLSPLAMSSSEWAEQERREVLLAADIEREGVAV